MVQKENLFEQFPPVSTHEWMDKIHADLKGADFNRKLVWKTNEGFEVKPFYRSEDIENLNFTDLLPGEFPCLRAGKAQGNSWLVRQNIEVTDYHEANRKALSVLMKGVDSIGFTIADPESVNADNFEILLNGIFLESIEVNFWCNGKAREILDILINIVSSRNIDPSSLHGAIEADPLGRLMLNGTLCIPVEAGLDYLASLTLSSSTLPHYRTIQINASVYGNSGADIVQELAFALSMGSEYLSQLSDRGTDPEFAASRMGFTFGTGSNYFFEIAKLRAARLLWSAVNRGFNPDRIECRMNIHSVTTRWNKTIYDPFVNVLRTQTEAMSSILGGADSVTVEPFDVVFSQPGEFSERIARNQQLILKEESYFDKVADPGAGSYFIENLTDLIARNAWKLFIEVEENGGFLSCLKSGLIQKKISGSAEKRKIDLANRKTTLLGTSLYPNPAEKLSPDIDFKRVFPEKANGEEKSVDKLSIFRGAEEFERIRIPLEKSSKLPVVFLLPIGDPVMRKARAKFSSGFFGCAGYKIIEGEGFKTAEEGIKSAVDSKAGIVVICSADEEYPVYAPEIYKELSSHAIVVVAGNPACAEELQLQGIKFFIHIKSNVPEMLSIFNMLTGVPTK